MTDLPVLTAVSLPALVEDGGGRLARLVVAWLLGYGSPHTRRAYARDLTGWATWCARLDVDPLVADRVHVDTWVRYLAEGVAFAPATVACRLAAVSARTSRWL
ncbi:site-specific integrase [Pseudonocardia kunmingensis]|uniref:site-specific integrase n=1 Tax=Pseudonocardia kunmingensis TaxID=630975 RepID=UPI001152C01F|nr:site-specific integrase [Pseudonocardia kunmingensis]